MSLKRIERPRVVTFMWLYFSLAGRIPDWFNQARHRSGYVDNRCAKISVKKSSSLAVPPWKRSSLESKLKGFYP